MYEFGSQLLDPHLTAGSYGVRLVAVPNAIRNGESAIPLCTEWGFA